MGFFIHHLCFSCFSAPGSLKEQSTSSCLWSTLNEMRWKTCTFSPYFPNPFALFNLTKSVELVCVPIKKKQQQQLKSIAMMCPRVQSFVLYIITSDIIKCTGAGRCYLACVPYSTWSRGRLCGKGRWQARAHLLQHTDKRVRKDVWLVLLRELLSPWRTKRSEIPPAAGSAAALSVSVKSIPFLFFIFCSFSRPEDAEI